MKRLIGLLLLLGLVGFYAAWPAWSGYQIKTALDGGDKVLLAQKIDFDRVRASLRPAVTAEVDKSISAAVKASGQPAAVVDKIKAETAPKLVDAALNGIVTPDSVIRLYKDRTDLKSAVARIVAEQMMSPAGLAVLGSLAGAMGQDQGGGGGAGNVLGQLGKLAQGSGVDAGKLLGGLFGKPKGSEAAAPAGAPAAASAGGGFGLSNIKSFALSGLAGYSIGIAKDAAATGPDLVADIAYSGGDWKLVGLTPRL
jgi:hypothetical protein